MIEKQKRRLAEFARKRFSFEEDVDLSNQTEVLNRKNIVIKNIIFLSNMVYSALLFVVTLGSSDPGAWLYSVIPFPLTFLINKTIKKLININDEYITQRAAMYLSTFYMFLSAIIIYVKLAAGTDDYLSTAGYMLIYYSLVVVSLYQDKKLLKIVFSWSIPIMTIIHMFITHKVQNLEYASGVFSFLKEFFTTLEFRDIFFRTIILCCFMIAVYTITIIGEKLSRARTQELGKRHEIQSDFTNIVTDLFDVLIKSRSHISKDEGRDIIFNNMTKKLSSLCGYNPTKCDEIGEYALFLSKHENDFKIETTDSEEENFEILRTQTSLGIELVKRIELSQKTETIVRAHSEGRATVAFSNDMNKIQKSNESDIILLCDIYISLREPLSYQRPVDHQTTIDLLKNQFSVYFDSNILDRFVVYQQDFEGLYDQV